MISQAGLAVIQKIADRRKPSGKSPHETAIFVGISGSIAVFQNPQGDRISMPVKNVITTRSWSGVFSISRPKYGYPSAFKEV